MTSKERVKKVLNFQKADRIPVVEFSPFWDLTIDRWKNEGMPEKYHQDYSIKANDSIMDYFGLDPFTIVWVRSYKENFVYYGYDINSIEDYLKMKDVLYPEDLYFAPDFDNLSKQGDIVGKSFAFYVDGFFWLPRFMMGVEKHLLAYYDIPDVMKQIGEDNTAYLFKVLDRMFGTIVPEMVVFAEDMAYKGASMISKDLFDEFIAPYYKKIIPYLKNKGIKVIVDSDGMLDELIEWFVEIGVDGFTPIENQAGCDVVRYRKNYPDTIFFGGFDKTKMVFGEEELREEFERILPAMKKGGYIPSVDHQTPPGVSLDNYRIYLKLLREYCEKAMEDK